VAVRSAVARCLESRVPVPLRARMFVPLCWVCFESVAPSTTGRSLIQSSPTLCVFLIVEDLETSTMRRISPKLGFGETKKIKYTPYTYVGTAVPTAAELIFAVFYSCYVLYRFLPFANHAYCFTTHARTHTN
jgi:hypothetical protein